MFLLSNAGFLVLVLGMGSASFSLRSAQLSFKADCNFFWHSNMFRNYHCFMKLNFQPIELHFEVRGTIVN
jgi:hypothetical protein